MRSAHKKSEGLGSNVWPPLAQPGPAGPKWKSIPTCLTFCYGTGNALRFSFGSDPCHNCHCQKMGFSSEMSSPAAVSGGRHTTGGDTLQSPRPAVWRVRPQCVGSIMMDPGSPHVRRPGPPALWRAGLRLAGMTDKGKFIQPRKARGSGPGAAP